MKHEIVCVTAVYVFLLLASPSQTADAFLLPRHQSSARIHDTVPSYPTAATTDPRASEPQKSPRGEADKHEQVQLPNLTQVDVIYGSKTSLVYDAKTERFLPTAAIRHALDEFQYGRVQDDNNKNILRIVSPLLNSPPITACRKLVAYHVQPYLAAAFVPEGVTPAYHRYTRWRVLQRWVNANLQVFGTQSLLLGLGIKTKSLAAYSAALNWVLKDALGKVVRLIWASRMGGKFDSDAKRWRMRASFLYALGNGMEIACYVFPQVFLLFATTANCCKQMSMLTCSSTRTALYNSFRDGSRENIGDITAKGEASIAVVDLLGIATGVSLSTKVGTSVGAVLSVYALLQTIEILCIYKMMRSVQFRVLNFERLCQVLNAFIGSLPTSSASSNSTLAIPNNAQQDVPNNGATFNNGAVEPILSSTKTVIAPDEIQIKTPEEMALTEKILQPPAHLARRAFAFGSLGRARLDPEELKQLLDIFAREKFLLVVGKNMKAPRRGVLKRLMRRFNALEKNPRRWNIQENCHIVLHTEATNADIVKSSLALLLLRKKLSLLGDVPDPDEIRSRDCLDLIDESCQQADRLLPKLLRQMQIKGWTSPARFMFGRVTMRADWPIIQPRGKKKSER
ncbi:Protein root UVB sensitive [Seminavis robusta]|uniref:Protein root UVB sensitive n=1 Tax=Seminavis robusta TaxID=568900 RepID=A0A9N8F0D0_9STRA|nr:Protein root UVB sensitive [Seminavis robusta]|eukprot:Sro2848_g338490.1 Protein root UVB sensitive (624) ;mRNA; r:2259-4130